VRRLASGFVELATPRLRLREITAADVGWYQWHFSRPEIVRGTGFPAPADRRAAEKELRAYVLDLFERREGVRWGICLAGSDELIGSIGFYRWTDGPPAQAELGYDLAPDHWGAGLMGEALAAVLAFGFESMALDRVIATVMVRNDRSMHVLERAGFTRDGLLRGEGTDEHGAAADEWLFVLEAPDDATRRPSS
jgi:ribosomal-protein-alanine N-acetyltransferase